MNNFKPLFGIVLAIGFLILGFYLTKQENIYKVIVGYISILFWSVIILLALKRLITPKKK
jgi:hypothetical protein